MTQLELPLPRAAQEGEFELDISLLLKAELIRPTRRTRNGVTEYELTHAGRVFLTRRDCMLDRR